jgi:RNA polymerase sigma factor (sigma-70 family)
MASDGTFSSQAENASVAALLDRMRRGDRSAASEFVLAYGPLIRGRFRNRLSPRMRSYFDSLDLVSTVARRLDQYIASHDVDCASPGQLFGLVFDIARASCIDKQRLLSRLDRTEGPDSPIADALRQRLRQPSGRSDEASFDLDTLLRKLPDQEDAELVLLWLDDRTFEEIGASLGMSGDAAKKRWYRLRPILHALLTEMAED